MGVASGCGCKEVYRDHNITYPYSSFFLQQQHPGVYLGGAGGIRPPLSYSRPPLNFQIFKKFNECMMYNSLFTII